MIEVLENIIERVKGYEREARLEAGESVGRSEFEPERGTLSGPVIESFYEMEQTLEDFWQRFDEKFPAI